MKTPLKTLTFLACLMLAAPPLAAKAKHAVLLLAREHPDSLLIIKEVNPMVELLAKAGFRVVIASEHGTQIGSGGAVLKPDLKFSAVVLTDYAGVVIPCMEAVLAGDNLPISPAEVKLAKAAAARQLPIAAQDLGVAVLGSAGLLKGKQYASDGENSGFRGIYKGTGVVVDGKFMTSGVCPVVSAKHGTAELMAQFIQILKAQK